MTTSVVVCVDDKPRDIVMLDPRKSLSEARIHLDLEENVAFLFKLDAHNLEINRKSEPEYPIGDALDVSCQPPRLYCGKSAASGTTFSVL